MDKSACRIALMLALMAASCVWGQEPNGSVNDEQGGFGAPRDFGPPGDFGPPRNFGPPPGAFFGAMPGPMAATGIALLRIPEVQRELQLAPQQAEQIDAISRQWDKAIEESFADVDFAGPPRPRDGEAQNSFAGAAQKAEAARKDADSAAAKILEPAQSQRLKQLELQRMGAAALLSDDVVEKLALTKEQRTQIEALQPAGFGSGPFPPPPPRVVPEMLAALTDEQRRTWSELVGAEFQFPVRFSGFPGGGGFGPGGMFGQDREILADYDDNHDGWLNRDERAAARQALADQPARGGRGPFGRGGPGGRRGGPFGGRIQSGTPGPKVDVDDVEPVDAPLYDPKVVRTLFLQFESDDWEAELEAFHRTDVDVPATLVVDGKSYPNVGVRFRGASSYMMIPKGSKRSLNLSLDLADSSQRLYGYKTLNLLNAHEDPSFMHTVLYSQIARQHMPAPKANFVRLAINGESWGLYVNAQQFDKIFVAENFSGAGGARWKVQGSPGGRGGLDYIGERIEDYRARYEIKSDDDDEDWRALIALCRTLDQTPPERLEEALAPMLDIDGALWFLALDVALVNSDGYWIRASDYNLYLNEQGKFHVVPHDMNETFQPPMGPGMGGFGGGMRRAGGRGAGPPDGRQFGGPAGNGFGPPPGQRGFGGGPGGPPNGFGPPAGAGGYEVDPLVGLDDPAKPLRSKLLAVPSLRARYLEYVRDIAATSLDWNKLGPVVSEIAALIEPEVAADTRKLTSLDEFHDAVAAADAEDPAARRHSLYTFAQERRKFLLNYEEPSGD